MPQTINWIHLTDLHFGLDDRDWLWPRVKHDFFKDIERLSSQVDGWDLVFFTGDFVQSGNREQYDRLNKELEALWKVFGKSGRIPKLCAVPGNHDLTRPDASLPVIKALTQLWSTDPEVRKQFWQDVDCEYRKIVRECFLNYTDWNSKLSVPQLTPTCGLLPGDFSATYCKGPIKLGILGLNSTFLQLTSGDYQGKLDMHVSQLNAICDSDPATWLKERTVSVLLMHQPPSWLNPDALDHFRQEIYPPSRFLAMFCGHQHEPETSEQSEAGAGPRWFRQGASLFGLDKWNGVTEKQRIHGYTAGQYLFEDGEGLEKYWPRIAVKGRHGGLNLCPDHTFKLAEGDVIVNRFSFECEYDGNDLTKLSESTFQDDDEEPTTVGSVFPSFSLLDQSFDETTARQRLYCIPRFTYSLQPHHRFVRQEEQSQCENQLRKTRIVWLVADWGTEEGFIASCVERLLDPAQSPEVYQLRCDDASDIDGFESLFPQQFGFPIQAACALFVPIKGPFLLLDGIHPGLCVGEPLKRFRRIISAILDYCPQLKIILKSRVTPEGAEFPVVELHGLEVPDVRTYLTHHPDAEPWLLQAEVVEKLHERSEGLPLHLERMLKALKVSSLASVLEADMESSEPESATKDAPKALIHQISALAKSEDKRSQRSFRMLKVLSMLQYGETLDALRHYLPTEPFFDNNAIQLNEMSLIDSIPLQNSHPTIDSTGPGMLGQMAPKVLKAPRQVRDYVRTLLSDDEREEIVLAGIERFFGRSWRNGTIKLRKLPLEYREYLGSGCGNEFALIHHLITNARAKDDRQIIRRCAALGIHYLDHLNGAQRFRDVTSVAEALLQIVDRDQHPMEWCYLASKYGKGLRMTGKYDQALKYLGEVLDTNKLKTSEQASIWLQIAYVEEIRRNSDAAIGAADKVLSLAKQDTGLYLSALAVKSNMNPDVEKKRKELVRLEKRATSKGYVAAAENVAFDLATLEHSQNDKVKYYNKILTQKPGAYNRARAIVSKAEAFEKLGKLSSFAGKDMQALVATYSYLHLQRFGILTDRCHEMLWQIFDAHNDRSQLLRLFRHSSFLWRIRGDETKESDYLKRLQIGKDLQIEENPPKGLLVEFRYFLSRLKAIFSR